MTMFSAACYQFARSVGKNTLIPAPSIDEKDNVKPLQLVVKTTKRRYLLFHKTSYHPTDFQMTDVFTDNSPLKLQPAIETELINYNRKTELSLKGKFGADLAKEIIDIELEADDKITVNIDFGKVMKKEVHIPPLMAELSRRNINMSHSYIKQISKDSRKVPCVITGMAYLDKGGTVHRETKIDGNASLTSKLTKAISPDAEGEYDKGKDLGLAPGTPIAYCVHELNVDIHSGGMELVLGKGKTGGFKEGISYDEPDAGSEAIDFQNALKVFEALISLPESQRQATRDDLLAILEAPHDLLTLAELLYKCESKQLSEDGMELELISVKETVGRVLGLAGIQFSDDTAYPPKSDNTMLPCLAEFFDAAAELDDDVLALIRKCSPAVSAPILTVLQKGIMGTTMDETETVQKLVKDSEGSHIKLLQDLGFGILPSEIQAPTELPYYIDAVYWVFTALWA